MGKHASPNDRLAHPRIKYLRLGDIEGVHPAVRKKRKHTVPEPLVGLGAVREDIIKDVFAVPHIAVVPTPGRKGYWVWIGIRSYLRLLDIKWPEKFPVLDYGVDMPEEKIVKLACADFRFGYIFSGRSAKSDWAIAQEWEGDTDKICKPAKPKSGRRPSGLRAYARLCGLTSRRLRADKNDEAREDTDDSGTANDEEDQGTED